ncbi:HD domain-containing protein [Marine Group I thaumarchaeote]|uniref:HD domain-containing protein n=1 Tax=Marine Group I thaumarchaeote TaxID=2511932 RepID=A0A7K4P3G0_9ARCH|nr:MAG: HD domain-containing protein [Nitrosopumilus sp. YT1]NWJ56826.1 HD domain-containing protein [Marine Group I thaumarchaeote]NWJ83829.1 HD domain-containing protein [Marine Group I thaumarchaeote]NWK13272.1 HD domain-containing protein [Marine Group I thaumarchaeote]
MNVLDSIKNEVKKRTENDSAHDFEHTMRVYKNAQKICKKEKANEKLVLSAALLHDIVSYLKSAKHSKMSSIESAKKSKNILEKFNFSKEEITIILDAISDHSFSQNKIPKTLEGQILQDADRLDALGAIGIARVFATGGSLKRPFYNIDDPFCKRRIPDDKIWTVDHFFQKLFKLESLMNTKSGKVEAKKRTRILKEFLTHLKQEL